MSSNNEGPANFLLIVVGVVFAGIVIVLDIYDLPPVTWVNSAQASVLGGRYYPKLTFLIVFLMALIPVGIIAGIVKLVQAGSSGTTTRERGRRRDDDEDDEPRHRRRDDDDEDEPRPRRPRSRRDDDDEPPPPRRSRRDDEEDEPPPPRRSRRDDDEDDPPRRPRR